MLIQKAVRRLARRITVRVPYPHLSIGEEFQLLSQAISVRPATRLYYALLASAVELESPSGGFCRTVARRFTRKGR